MTEKAMVIAISALGLKLLLDNIQEKKSEIELIDELTRKIDDINTINQLMKYRELKIQYIYLIDNHIKKIRSMDVDIKGVVRRSDLVRYIESLKLLLDEGHTKFRVVLKNKLELLRLLRLDKFRLNPHVESLRTFIEHNTEKFGKETSIFYDKLSDIVNTYEEIYDMSSKNHYDRNKYNNFGHSISDTRRNNIYRVKSATKIPSKSDILDILTEYYEGLETEKYIISGL